MVNPPLLKSVCAAVTVQLAEANARASATVHGPIGALIVVPGAPEPRLADTGTVMVRAPDVTVKVIVVAGSPDTDCVSVAVYKPATAPGGTFTATVGFQVAVLSPTPAEPVTTVWAEFESVTFVPVAVMVPVVVIVPTVYVTSAAGMVNPPLLKSVCAAVTVQLAEANVRASITVHGPIGALIVVPGAPEPRMADTGTVMVRAPVRSQRSSRYSRCSRTFGRGFLRMGLVGRNR
jgi:hypothetical protein